MQSVSKYYMQGYILSKNNSLRNSPRWELGAQVYIHIYTCASQSVNDSLSIMPLYHLSGAITILRYYRGWSPRSVMVEKLRKHADSVREECKSLSLIKRFVLSGF